MKHTPRKRFGQNFLHDEGVIDDIISAVDIRADDLVVEIGPGQGALTYPLLACAKTLHVVELDRDLAREWRTRVEAHPNLVVHEADALKVDFAGFSPGQSMRLVGNLPYNISTPLLFHFCAQKDSFSDLHVMLQKEVADRICAPPGSKTYGRLSVMLAAQFDSEALLEIPPDAFFPAPKVTSVFLRLTPRHALQPVILNPKLFADIVRQAFSQRRKTIRKSLKSNLDKDDFDTLQIDSGLRPEALSLEQFSSLANLLHQKQHQFHPG